MTQALHFAYVNNLLVRDISSGVTKFSNRSGEKEIFSQQELKMLFNSGVNHFERKDCFLINKLLIKTGCRIGEVLALQRQDIIHTENGYVLNVSKSYNDTSDRVKETAGGECGVLYFSWVPARMSFSYEKLTENCIFHLLDANQHRGLYIAREFSVKKTRTGGSE